RDRARATRGRAHGPAGGRSARAARAAGRGRGRPDGRPVSRPLPRAAAVRVPGSTSNLGGGFDCVGMAVDRFLDASFTPGPDELAVERGDGAAPPGEDLVAVSFTRVLAARGMSARGILRV